MESKVVKTITPNKTDKINKGELVKTVPANKVDTESKNECYIIVKTTKKNCRKPAIFREQLGRHVCSFHFTRWANEVHQHIKPRYKGLELSSDTIYNYMFFMLLYRN